MPAFVHGALVAALLLSALGAVVVCLVVVFYGFTGPDDEPPLTIARRQMYTRIGHALATTCFAGTAILIGMVLVRAVRPVTAPVVQDARIPQLDARVDAQASRVAAMETRSQTATAGLTRAETRLNDVEESLRRLTEEGRRTEHRVGRLEQTGSRVAVTDRPVATRKPTAIADATLAKAPARVAPAPPSASPVALTPPSPAPEPMAAPSPPPPVAPAPASSPPALNPAPTLGHEVSPLASPSSREGEPATPVGTTKASSSPPAGFRAKLQQDWEAVQKGFESSRDDIRRAWAVTKRKLQDLVD
jgi:hypothetical protein